MQVTSESMSTKYWLTACSSLPRKKCGYVNWSSPMTIAVDWDVKQQNKQNVSIKRIWDAKTAGPKISNQDGYPQNNSLQ